MGKLNCLIYTSAFSIILFFVISNYSIYASSSSSAASRPIFYNGIKYSAQYGRDKNGDWVGYINAQNNVTGKTIWKRKVYTIKIKRNLEEDVQWVFIEKLNIKGGLLIVRNEKGSTYYLNLITGIPYNFYTLSFIVIVLSVLIALYIYYKRKKAGKLMLWHKNDI